MKTKLLNKKLGFKKETISNLENARMDDIRGGVKPPPYTYVLTCASCITSCAPTVCENTCCTSYLACSC